MVKAGDIGKSAKDFLNKDFFSTNEVKITSGCCSEKHTSSFKVGDAITGDHKIEYAQCPMSKGPISLKLVHDTTLEVEKKLKGVAPGVDVNLTFKSNMAKFDPTACDIKKTLEFNKNMSGVDICLDLVSGIKGTAPKPMDLGLSFVKNGYQLGYSAKIDNVLAPSVSNQLFRLGFAGCSKLNAFVETSNGSDAIIRASTTRDGRQYGVDFDAASYKFNIATSVMNGKMKVSSDKTLTSYQKFPVNNVLSVKSSAVVDLFSGKISSLAFGAEFNI